MASKLAMRRLKWAVATCLIVTALAGLLLMTDGREAYALGSSFGSSSLTTAQETEVSQQALSGDRTAEASASNSQDAQKTKYARVYRLRDPRSTSYLYTTSKRERNNVVPQGWRYESVGWQAPETGSAVYRLYNPGNGDRFYTTSKSKRKELRKAGWRNEGVSFRSASEYDQESAPVYRLYSRSLGHHCFTMDSSEVKRLLKDGWRNEGVAFYGKPASGAFQDDMASDGMLTVKKKSKLKFKQVYRLYSPLSQKHFFTASKKKRNALSRKSWHYEGIGWRTPTAGNPVYKLSNPRNGDYVYTMDPRESGKYVNRGWAFKGTAFYSCTDDVSQRVPVYRLYNKKTHRHMLTIGKAERKALRKAGWKSEGIAFYGKKPDPSHVDDLQIWTSLSGDDVLDAYVEGILKKHGTLRSAYDYVTAFPYRSGNRFFGGSHYLGDSVTRAYAREMFENRGGNCYRYACLFCWLARGLGYQANVVSGWVPQVGGGQAPHGWVEIYVNGKTFCCDPDMAHAIPGRNWYMFTYSDAPTNYGSW